VPVAIKKIKVWRGTAIIFCDSCQNWLTHTLFWPWLLSQIPVFDALHEATVHARPYSIIR